MPTASAEDSEEVKARVLEEQEQRTRKREQRSNAVVVGLNQVIKALEKGTLRLVLVDRSIKPEALLGHLLILSATRNVPACALHGIGGSAVPFLLGVPRVAAIGFKSVDIPTIFDELVHFIKERIPPLQVPWLHITKADTAKGADESDEEPEADIMEIKRKRRRRKSNWKTSEQKTQTTASNPARPRENTGKPVTLTREQLLAVFGTTNTAPMLQESGDTKPENEPKGKKKRRRRSKKYQGKRKIELVYLRPVVKSIATMPKDK